MDFELSFEQQELVTALKRFVETELYPHEDLVERERGVPPDLAAEIKKKAIDNGFYAMNMPEELGGGGLDALTLSLAEKEIGKAGSGLGILIGRPTRILLACKDDQIEEYLMPSIRGERKNCFALTEPGAGSDARAITTRAVKDGDDFIVNGTKLYISAADISDFIILNTVSGVEETPRGPRKLFTTFLLDKNTPGVTVTPMLSICTHGYNPNTIYLEDVRIPKSKILGEEGKGFSIANEWLYAGRVMLSAHCVGRGERVMEMTADWAANRKAFGKAIGDFQGTGFKLADMATELRLADLMTLNCAWKMDQGTLTRQEASMCNVFASEMIFRLTDNAMQIFGGMSMMEDFPIQRYWRDARVERIWEGTSEIHRDIIARDILKPYRK